MLPEKTYVSSQHQARDFKNVMVRAAHAAGSQVTEEAGQAALTGSQRACELVRSC